MTTKNCNCISRDLVERDVIIKEKDINLFGKGDLVPKSAWIARELRDQTAASQLG